MKKLIIFGSGAHCKIVKDIAEVCGYKVVGFIADTDTKEFLGCPVFSRVENIKRFEKYCYFIAIGNNKFRKEKSEKYHYLCFVNLIHPTAIVSKYAKIGVGNLLMPYTVVNAYAEIGNQNILNTASIVEHDCRVGSYCHISVNSAITGVVSLGDGVFLGAGSVVKNAVSIGEWTTVGAGACVVKNLDSNGVYVGCPAKLLKK